MERLLVVAVVLAVAGCSPLMRKRIQTGALVGIGVTTACDVKQTLWMRDGGAYDRPGPYGYVLVENNPLLGDRPSAGVIVGSAILASVAVAGIAASDLPDRYKTPLLVAIGILETANVVHNGMRGAGVLCGEGDPHAMQGPALPRSEMDGAR